MEEMIRARLEELRSVTPSGATSLFNDFETVCRKYYERGESFKQALYDAYIGQMFDVFMTDFRCRDQERLPSLSGSIPEYYDDIEAVFKGRNGELYPFNGMLRINLQTFRLAYQMQGGGSTGQASTWENAYLEQWTDEINRAKANEEARLRAIKYYALRRYRPWSPPLTDEDLGWRRQVWGNNTRPLKYSLFESRNWRWVFDAFEMGTSMPAFLEELEDEDDDRA